MKNTIFRLIIYDRDNMCKYYKSITVAYSKVCVVYITRRTGYLYTKKIETVLTYFFVFFFFCYYRKLPYVIHIHII